jgi:hypothetical protein
MQRDHAPVLGAAGAEERAVFELQCAAGGQRQFGEDAGPGAV